MKTAKTDSLPTLHQIQQASRPELLALYRDLLEHPAPKRSSLDFLRGNLAWTIQALQSNKDPAELRARLIKQSTRPSTSGLARYKAGTRLIREWHGQTHEVTILDKGYRWRGKHYTSLTRIAREITGTNWSGPRFFGITGDSDG